MKWYTEAGEILKLIHKKEELLITHIIAQQLENKGIYDLALEKYEFILESEMKIYGTKNVENIAITLGSLAGTYSKKGNHEKAMLIAEEALNIYQYLSATTENDNFLNLKYFFAREHSILGNINKAKDIFEEIYNIELKKHGSEFNKDVAMTLHELSRLYFKLGNLEESLVKFQEVKKIREKIYENLEHPEIADSIESIGMVLYEKKEFQKALDKHMEARDMRLKIYKNNESHPDAILSNFNIGKCLSKLEKFQESLSYFEKVFELETQIYHDEDHVQYIKTLEMLALQHSKLKNYDKSIYYLVKTLSIMSKNKIDDNQIARIKYHLAIQYEKQGKLEDSVQILKDVLVIKNRNQTRKDEPLIKKLSELESKLLSIKK